MAPASPSQTATIGAEFVLVPRTPTSERSWRHFPSLRSNTYKFPIAVSEGRSRIWGSLSVRGQNSSPSANDNGSPTRLRRRKSIADLFNGLSPSKKHKERTESIGASGTRSRSPSPSKKDNGIGDTSAGPKRRKNITNLFGTSLRGHRNNSIAPERPSISHEIPSCLENPPIPVVNPSLADGEKAQPPVAKDTEALIQVPPILRIHFADGNSEGNQDAFEKRPENTRISGSEIEQPQAERRNCAASNSTWASNALTLTAEESEDDKLQSEVEKDRPKTLDSYLQSLLDPNGDKLQSEVEKDRPKTPDSYLRLLIESYESPRGASSVGRECMSPTPSPAEHHAVQPLDFLADKNTPPLVDRYSSKGQNADFEISCQANTEPKGKRRATLKCQDLRLPISWFDPEGPPAQFKPHDRTHVADDNALEPTPNVFDIDSNFRQRLQERKVRFKSLEIESTPSHNPEKDSIAENIRLAVAKMTRNYHSSQSSDEDHASPLSDTRVPSNRASPFYDNSHATDSSQTQNCMFKIDGPTLGGSMTRGAEIMLEASRYKGVIKTIPSPELKPKLNFVMDRTLQDPLELRATPESAAEQVEREVTSAFEDFENQQRRDIRKIRVSRSSSEDIPLDELKKFGESFKLKTSNPFDLVPINDKRSVSAKQIKTRAVAETNISAPLASGIARARSLLPAIHEATNEEAKGCYSFPPAYLIDNILEDSRDIRVLDNDVYPSSSRIGAVPESTKLSNSSRRNVSTDPVQTRFPATLDVAAYIQTFESKSKAIAAIYDYRLGPLSNFVVYDPVKRTLYAQELGAPSPDAEKLREKGLKLVWLPLQPNCLFEEAAANVYQDGKPEPYAQGIRPPFERKDRNQETITVKPRFTATCDVFCGSDSGVEGHSSPNRHKGSESLLELVASLQDDSDSHSQEPDWTVSDEEYLLEVNPETARSYLGSQFSDSGCSTPKLERGTLLYPDLAQALFDNETLYGINDTSETKSTKTWPQLAQEFRAKCPERFNLWETPILEDELGACISDADSESSSMSSAWSSQVPDPYIPTRNTAPGLEESSDQRQEQYVEKNSSQLPEKQTASRSDQFYHFPITEHVENIDGDEGISSGKTVMTVAPNNSDCDTEDSCDSVLGIHATCGHLQCLAENRDESSRLGSVSSWRSWVEAQLAEAKLFQADATQSKNYFGLPMESVEKPASIGQLEQRPTNSSSISEFAQSRRGSMLPFTKGFPFTAYSEIMLEEHHRLFGSSSNTSGDDGHPKATLLAEAHSADPQNINNGLADQKMSTIISDDSSCMNGSLTETCKAVVVDERITEESGLLEAVDIPHALTLSAAAPEVLNLRLVGKAARQSQLAKSSKISGLVDLFKAHGLISQTLKPARHKTQASKLLGHQSSSRTAGPSARIVTPSGNIYTPSRTVCAGAPDALYVPAPVKRVPTPASVLSDAPTELDGGFGEELDRVEKNEGMVGRGTLSDR